MCPTSAIIVLKKDKIKWYVATLVGTVAINPTAAILSIGTDYARLSAFNSKEKEERSALSFQEDGEFLSDL